MGRHDLRVCTRVLATSTGTLDRAEGVATAIGLNVDGQGAASSLAVSLSGEG